MQTEATMRYHYTPTRIVMIKNQPNKKSKKKKPKKQAMKKMLSHWNSNTLLVEI